MSHLTFKKNQCVEEPIKKSSKRHVGRMVRTKLTHGQVECMEVTREFEGKEVKRIREDVSIGDCKTLKQERNKVMS